MFRLSRNNKGAKSGDRVEFRFSNFKALQVPKGWDKLFVSIVLVETGKIITKSSKAVVRNGSCEWTDTLLESIWSPQNESSKEVDDCLFKFVVAMGSARSGILGETTINMTSYMSSTNSVSVSLPLKKNSHGTVLQLTIQCMAQRTKARDGESKESNSHVEDLKVDSHVSDVKSEVSDSVSPQSVASSSSKDRSSASHPGEPESRQTSFSASGSHDSYESADIFLSREALSPTATNIRQDGNYLADDASQTHQSSPSPVSRSGNNYLSNRPDHSPTSSLRNPNSSINLLEAAEDAIEELRAEARMWERNARKLMLDLDTLREEFLNQSKNQANLEIELSATRTECSGLVKEVERLKLLPEKSSLEDSALEDSGATHLQKELEDEIRLQRESSADLAMLLKRSQESNIELVALLQELELEKSAVQSKVNDLENALDQKMEENVELSIRLQQVQESEKNLKPELENHDSAEMGIAEMEALKEKVQELENDCNELTDENLELLFKLKELNNKSTGLCASCTNLNNKVIDDRYDVSVQELESIITELRTELDKTRSELASKEEGIAELEAKVSDLEKENTHLEENMKAVARESDITSKCLNGLQNDLLMLSSSVGTHVSANKMLQRKSSELESGRSELQLRLVELEEENAQLTGESESGRFELEHFKSLAENLEDEVARLRNGMEIQSVELQNTQRACSEVEEECDHLRRSNLELQETSEKLVEECNTLRKLNLELGDQNVELNNKCVRLEAKLRESSKSFSECSHKVGILEENLSSALEDVAAKEQYLTSELDALLEENKEQKEKLAAQETLFNEMYLAKSLQVENLQEEVHHLSEKLSTFSDERDRIVSEATCLREEKGKIEAYSQEIESKLENTENELNVMHIKSGEKVEGLKAELSATKQNQIKLIADHEKVKNLLEKYRSSEENFKNAVSNLELNLTVCEYERQQLLEEKTNLKAQLQKMELLHDEVTSYKNTLAATDLEKDKLEDYLQQLSVECKELKEENISLVEKVSTLQTSRVALEVNLLQVENDLIEKEADLRKELDQISRANSQFQRKIQQLEKEKDECLTKSHALEDELKSMKEERQNQREFSSVKAQSATKTNARASPAREDMKFSKNEIARGPKSPNHLRDNRRKLSSKNDQGQELTRNRQKPHNIQHHKESNGSSVHDQNSQSADSDSFSKIQLLENELAKAMEANKTFKAQLNRLKSEGQNQHHGAEVVAKERFERTKSSLETELKDIRERYLNMSLQYAEVEAQREELVMKLRAAKNGKRWFS